jgi:hypothetical protein
VKWARSIWTLSSVNGKYWMIWLWVSKLQITFLCSVTSQ